MLTGILSIAITCGRLNFSDPSRQTTERLTDTLLYMVGPFPRVFRDSCFYSLDKCRVLINDFRQKLVSEPGSKNTLVNISLPFAQTLAGTTLKQHRCFCRTTLQLKVELSESFVSLG